MITSLITYINQLVPYTVLPIKLLYLIPKHTIVGHLDRIIMNGHRRFTSDVHCYDGRMTLFAVDAGAFQARQLEVLGEAYVQQWTAYSLYV